MAHERPERQVMVALGWVHRGAKILMVRRHDPVLVDAHGRWEIPGGKIAFGEEPSAAVAREVLEETGYRVRVGPLLPLVYTRVWEYPDRRQQVFLLVFDCQAEAVVEPQPADPRVAEIAWVALDRLDAATTLPGVCEVAAWWRQRPANEARDGQSSAGAS